MLREVNMMNLHELKLHEDLRAQQKANRELAVKLELAKAERDSVLLQHARKEHRDRIEAEDNLCRSRYMNSYSYVRKYQGYQNPQLSESSQSDSD